MSKYLAFMATKEGLMLRMLNLKDQKANKNYLSICPLKQNKESLAVFRQDSVVFILSAVCIFCSFFSSLSVQPAHFNSRTSRKPQEMHTVACTSASPCGRAPQGMRGLGSLSSGKGQCHPIPSLSHFLHST